MNWQQDVREFMVEVKGLTDLPTKPTVRDFDTQNLCLSLIDEELEELRGALISASYDYHRHPLNKSAELQNMTQIADGIADLIYVTLYTAVSYGLDIEPIWAEVQRSNMTKKGGGKRADGKQLKPDSYEPPNIAAIIKEQSR